MAMALVFSTACAKKSSSEAPGRGIDFVPNDGTDDGTNDGTDDGLNDEDIDDIDRGNDDDIDDVATPPVTSGNILFNNYPNTIPTTKVCQNVLQGRSAATLAKFFNWNIQNLEGPVTVCVEQVSGAQSCPNNENYCDKYPNKKMRIRIEYEDDFKFWYYDSAKDTNYSKLLSYTGGGGSSTIEAIVQDGAGFLMVEGTKTSSGAYDVSFSFADRPSYSAAKSYDSANNFSAASSNNRTATLWNMKKCAESANGAAKYVDGSDCAARFVFAYQFFGDLNVSYSQTGITDTALWVQNQVTIARQYVKNTFPTQFATMTGYKGGTFGRLLLNGL